MLKPYRFSFNAEGVRHSWIGFFNNMELALEHYKQIARKEYQDAGAFMIESNQSETDEIPGQWIKDIQEAWPK